MALTPRWNYGGSTAYLRIFASVPFYEATTGEFIAQGSPTNPQSFYQQYTCTVSGTTLTIPAVTLATTVDSSVPNAVFTAVIYTSAGAQVYTLLSQFYVDASFFQVTPQSSVLVTGAGSSAANGVFTYRGQSGGYNYYNLQGNADSTTDNVIKRSGADWILTDNIPTTLYRGEFTVDFPWETVWATDGGSLPLPTVAQDTSLMTSTWENLTLSQGFGVIPVTYPGPFWNVAATMAYVNSVVANGTTTYANYLVAGITELDVAPASATQPIAIGVNSPSTGTGAIVRQVNPALTTPTATTLAIGGGTVITTSNCTGTGSLVKQVSASLTTPNINVATGTSLALGGGTALTSTNQTGTGSIVLNNAPTLVAPVLGNAACTQLVINGGTAITTSNCTGSGNLVKATAPTLSSPVFTSPTLGVAVATSIAIGGGIALSTSNQSGTGSLVMTVGATLVTPTLGVASATSIAIGGGTALTTTNRSGTGNLVLATAPTITSGVFVTPTLGVSAATSVTATGLIKSTGTAGIGYGVGAGGAVSQGTSRTTSVTLDKITGAITLFSAAGSGTPFTFTVSNSTVIATDTITLSQKSGTDAYGLHVSNVAAGSFKITVVDLTGTTTETPVISFAVIKAVAS